MQIENWSLEPLAKTGGSLKRCAYKGVDILRCAIGDTDARQTSAFVMVPFIGRITNGIFQFGDQRITLPPNMPPEPHAIHGEGWQTSWRVKEATDKLIMEHAHTGSAGWPWHYAATQVFSANNNALTLTMTLVNKSDRSMPGGLGWHPYFPRHQARIKADVRSIWTDEGSDLIGHSIQQITPDTDIRTFRPADALQLDHCFSAGADGVTMIWPEQGRQVRMESSSNLGHLTVYIPPDSDDFCVEPVSHAPDALNMSHPADVSGQHILLPGESMRAEIRLTVTLPD